MISGKLAALVAASLMASSSAAVAQSASPLSLANGPAMERAGADLEDPGQLGTIGYVAIGAGLIAVILLVLSLDNGTGAVPLSA